MRRSEQDLGKGSEPTVVAIREPGAIKVGEHRAAGADHAGRVRSRSAKSQLRVVIAAEVGSDCEVTAKIQRDRCAASIQIDKAISVGQLGHGAKVGVTKKDNEPGCAAGSRTDGAGELDAEDCAVPSAAMSNRLAMRCAWSETVDSGDIATTTVARIRTCKFITSPDYAL